MNLMKFVIKSDDDVANLRNKKINDSHFFSMAHEAVDNVARSIINKSCPQKRRGRFNFFEAPFFCF